jgi:hypothetical protein
MSTRKLGNVSLADYRLFLSKTGCKLTSVEGGHEKWVRKDLTRPIIVQTHESPVPEFIIRNALRNLGLTKKDFFSILFDVRERDKDNPKKTSKKGEPVMDDEDLCFCGSGKKYKDCHGK